MEYKARAGIIDKKNLTPRYYQVKQKIEEAIVLGHHKKGEKLPSERKLVEYFGVSRITIRRGLDELKREGIIEKKWGEGIYVKKSPRYVPQKAKIGLTIWQGKELTYHPGTLAMLQGIGEVIEKRGYGLEMLFITPTSVEKGDYLKIINNGNLAGIILSLQEIPEKDVEKIRKKIPNVISVNRFNNSKTIAVDFREATCQIMKHLFERGHTRIGLINGVADFWIAQHVFSGYVGMLKEKGIEVNNNLVRNGEYDYQVGFELTMDLLKHEKPTALISGDDFMALGMLDALRRLGLSCPRDMSVCSFNDFPFAPFAQPPLTTVKMPLRQLAITATEMLVELMEGGEVKEREMLKGKLIIRGSTGFVVKNL